MAYCIAQNNNGQPCKAQRMHKFNYCYRHNPDIPEADKLQASASGGASRPALTDAEPVTLRNVENIISLIESNVNEVRAGNLDPKTSNAIVQNITVLVRVYELAVIDSRVRRLESQAGIDSPDELISTYNAPDHA